jgi:hypothetical protein
MEWYKIVACISVLLFFIIAIITDGFDWLNDDNDIHTGGVGE